MSENIVTVPDGLENLPRFMELYATWRPNVCLTTVTSL